MPVKHYLHDETAYLSLLGDRVRAWRSEQGVTRKALSAASGVSERYLAQLEAGGATSRCFCCARSRAMGVPVETWCARRAAQKPSPSSACAAPGNRRSEKLAEALDVPFVELDPRSREGSRRRAWRSVRHVRPGRLSPLRAPRARARAGAARPRRDRHRREPRHRRGTYKLLRERCLCVWLKASPEEHMARRRAGRHAAVQGNSAALDEIRQLLADRDRLYSRADVVLDTSGKTLRASLSQLLSLVKT